MIYSTSSILPSSLDVSHTPDKIVNLTLQLALLPLILPFISPKAYSKLYPLQSILSLHTPHGVSLQNIKVTLPVLEEEANHLAQQPGDTSTTAGERFPTNDRKDTSWASSLVSTVTLAGSYLNLIGSHIRDESTLAKGYWKRDLDSLISDFGGRIPPLFEELRKVILTECTSTEGIFRRSTQVS